MGTKNRDRRRAKQTRRMRQARRTKQASAGRRAERGWTSPQEARVGGDGFDDAIELAVERAAHACCDSSSRDDLDERAQLLGALVAGLGIPGGQERVASRLADMLTRACAAALRRGWEPDEIVRYVRREAGATACAVLAAPLAGAARHRGHQFADGAGGAVLLDPDCARWSASVSAGVDALGVLEHAPALADLRMLGATARSARSEDDERQLARIRSLLAKAESSEFPEEAESCMAKAQELMTRHCIDRAVLDERDRTAGAGAPGVAARRVWLDDPYLQAKALLLAVVADANRCRAVVSPDLGFSTVVGYDVDLDATALLFTSLLVQAMNQLRTLGRAESAGARPRRASYRRSFLVSYARRIGVRLASASAAATAEADAALENRLLPVLARQADEVDKAIESLFGDLGRLSCEVTNFAGWAAGAAAADMADLAVRRTLAGTSASSRREGAPSAVPGTREARPVVVTAPS